MKNNTRRRLLVSSLCMLLVAIVAMGTATFAWFTSSTTATASNIKVQTIKASELQISKSDLNWGTTVDYGMSSAKTLLPVSSADGSAWYTGNAEDKTAFNKADDAVFTPVSVTLGQNTQNYVWSEALNVTNSGEADVENVTITASFDNAVAQYVKMAIVPADGNLGTNTATFTDCIYGPAATAYKPVTGDNSEGAEVTTKTTITVNVGTLSKDDVKNYNIYVWFEGQDPACYDRNAGQGIGNINFSVSGDTVEQ